MPYAPGRVEVPQSFVNAFLEQATAQGVAEDDRTFRCALGAADVKQRLLDNLMVRNADRAVTMRHREMRRSSVPIFSELVETAANESSRTFYQTVRDEVMRSIGMPATSH